ncbi:hypothetical protein NDU88_004272 [Pleurodeles waltl]|uniref:Uncharacterized protein n=1 Tax=Pleurodeles waltl TaxID=8319 RepID=A0AAV7TTM0_PLEWA|nr:hypothetical protein NDU88_004272 [Pleurodeles waltl]
MVRCLVHCIKACLDNAYACFPEFHSQTECNLTSGGKVPLENTEQVFSYGKEKNADVPSLNGDIFLAEGCSRRISWRLPCEQRHVVLPPESLSIAGVGLLQSGGGLGRTQCSASAHTSFRGCRGLKPVCSVIHPSVVPRSRALVDAAAAAGAVEGARGLSAEEALVLCRDVPVRSRGLAARTVTEHRWCIKLRAR